MRTHVLYISGLGDRYDPFRRVSLKVWRLWGVTAELVPMRWYEQQSFDAQFERITRAIEAIDTKKRVVVIGESAGATMALIAGSQHVRVAKTITLCGVTRANTPIAASLRRRAPALDAAVKKLATVGAQDISSVESIRARIDPVVNSKYSVALGARERVIWTAGHLTTIVLCLTVFSSYTAAIARQK